MEKEEYEQTQNEVLLIAELLKTLNLRDFLNTINHCETVAPLIDPTLYMKGARNLQVIKEIAQALYQVQKKIPQEF